ncbi:TadE family type IV pilus minor pilin [Actinosynnema sp. NPDC023587]|uniref:TadE family type IV pilus minor pilin n=1 Tax=Actinosynnema sp. NPDC023587 TaxID=3154695 RepID=UPI0033CBBAB4
MTVEAALAVCGLVAFVVLGVEVVMTVVAKVRCTDAAREVARLVARGDSARASTASAAIAPQGAELTIGYDGDTVRVEVTARRAVVDVHADAYAVLEPGVTGSTGTPTGAPAGTSDGTHDSKHRSTRDAAVGRARPRGYDWREVRGRCGRVRCG